MKIRIFLLMVALCVITVLSAGCGGEKTYKTGEGTVKVQENKVEVTTNDGSKSQVTASETGGVALPEAYPRDVVPIIDGGKVVLANKNEDADKKVSFWVVVESSKATADVYKFYQEVLKDASETQNSQTNNEYYITGTKGDNNFTVGIIPGADDNRKSTVQIFVGPKE